MKGRSAWIADYLNGHLSAGQLRRFEARMAEDPSLQKETARLANEMRILRELGLDPQREPRRRAINARLREAFLAARPPGRKGFRVLPALIGMAAVGAAILLAALFLPLTGDGSGPVAARSGPVVESSPPKDSGTIHLVLETEDPRIKIYWAFEKSS